MYSLDKKRGKVTLEWQFEDPYAANGGTSVAGVDPITPDNDDDDDASARSSRALRGHVALRRMAFGFAATKRRVLLYPSDWQGG